MERKSPYKAVVAFSGEHEYKGLNVSEVSLNGFPSNKIAAVVRELKSSLAIREKTFNALSY